MLHGRIRFSYLIAPSTTTANTKGIELVVRVKTEVERRKGLRQDQHEMYAEEQLKLALAHE